MSDPSANGCASYLLGQVPRLFTLSIWQCQRAAVSRTGRGFGRRLEIKTEGWLVG